MTRAASASSPTSRAGNRTRSSGAGLQILVNLDHRGAVGADPLVGDGAGCLIQIPDALLRDWAERQRPRPAAARRICGRHVLPAAGRRGARRRHPPASSTSSRVEGQPLLGWRDVPTDTTGLGEAVIETMPVIRQAIIGRGPKITDQDAFERKLLAIRKQTQNNLARAGEQSGTCPACASSTCRPSRPAPWSTRACCSRHRSAASTRTCATR